MENAPVLLVADPAVWQKQYLRFVLTAKRLRNFGWISKLPCAGVVLYLVGIYSPLTKGDVVFGHPSYEEYMAITEMAAPLFAASMVPWFVANWLTWRWYRKSYVALGFGPDGKILVVREIPSESTVSVAESSQGDVEGWSLETSR